MVERLAFSINEAAESLGVSRSSVKELIYTNQIRVVRVGRRVLISRQSLLEYLGDDRNPDDADERGNRSAC